MSINYIIVVLFKVKASWHMQSFGLYCFHQCLRVEHHSLEMIVMVYLTVLLKLWVTSEKLDVQIQSHAAYENVGVKELLSHFHFLTNVQKCQTSEKLKKLSWSRCCHRTRQISKRPVVYIDLGTIIAILTDLIDESDYMSVIELLVNMAGMKKNVQCRYFHFPREYIIL